MSGHLFHVVCILALVHSRIAGAEPRLCAQYRAERCLFAPSVSASIAAARCHPEKCAFDQAQVRHSSVQIGAWVGV